MENELTLREREFLEANLPVLIWDTLLRQQKENRKHKYNLRNI
jgi:hypothetical protein